MKEKYVIDAGVIALYFAGDQKVKEIVNDVYSGRAEAYMCEINIAEFLYNYAKVFGWGSALARHALIRNSPINIVGIDEYLTLEAAKLKLKYYNLLSIADCYLIALAKQRKAKVITTDEGVKRVKEVPTELIPT